MEEQREPRCLIAAGGTAGHVLPSLAVAEALSARGALVTFAGSPERVEARLVAEAGYAFDPFPVSGLPRRPGRRLAHALAVDARAPRACARILEARRPDVVLGGGGYVAGPMVYAAWRKKIPAALTEADAHLGLANRLAAPFARRVFLAYAIAGRGGDQLPGRRAPDPARAAGRARRGAAALLPAGRGPGAARLRRQPGCGGAERGGAGGVRGVGPHRPPPLRRALLRGPARPRRARRLPPAAVDRRLRRRARRHRPRARARRRLGVGGRRGREAGGARPLAERHRRPPDEERALLRGGRRRARRPGGGALAASRSSSARCSTTPARLAADGRGDAPLGAAGRRRRDRGGAARACPA